MSYALEFLPEAEDEAAAATQYYENQLPGLGVRFRLEMESVWAVIAHDPLLWRKRRGGYRRVNFPSFRHYVAFYVRGERVIVAAVGHAHRRPEYWKSRIPRR